MLAMTASETLLGGGGVGAAKQLWRRLSARPANLYERREIMASMTSRAVWRDEAWRHLASLQSAPTERSPRLKAVISVSREGR